MVAGQQRCLRPRDAVCAARHARRLYSVGNAVGITRRRQGEGEATENARERWGGYKRRTGLEAAVDLSAKLLSAVPTLISMTTATVATITTTTTTTIVIVSAIVVNVIVTPI